MNANPHAKLLANTKSIKRESQAAPEACAGSRAGA